MGQLGVDVDFRPYGILVGLFSVGLGKMTELADQLRNRIEEYKNSLIQNNAKWLRVRPDEVANTSVYDGLLEPEFFVTFGSYDLGLVVLVDDFSIVNVLATSGACDAMQFLCGPMLSRSKITPEKMRDKLLTTREKPLIGICQLRLNPFLSIDHGTEPLFHLADFINQQASQVVSAPEVSRDGGVHAPARLNAHSRAEQNHGLFLCHSWNQLGAIVRSCSYTEILQFVMDVREARLSDVNHGRQTPLRSKGDRSSEVEWIRRSGHYWKQGRPINTHVFNTTFTTLGFPLDIFRQIAGSLDEVKATIPDRAAQKEWLARKIASPEPVASLSRVKGKVKAAVSFVVKPGHFSAATDELDRSLFHLLPAQSREARTRINQDNSKHRRVYVTGGMADYVTGRFCHHAQGTASEDEVILRCHYPYQEARQERCPNLLDDGNSGVRCLEQNRRRSAKTAVESDQLTSEFIYSHCVRILAHAYDSASNDLDDGPDVYRIRTSISADVELLKRSITDHIYSQRAVQHKTTGFEEDELKPVWTGLRKRGIPRGTVNELQNIFYTYNSCLRTPQLFGHFLELYPYLYGLLSFLRYNSDPARSGNQALPDFLNTVRRAVTYYDRAFLAQFQGSYFFNEITDFNFSYKGGAQQLLSMLNGVQRILLRNTVGNHERGSFCLIGGACEPRMYSATGLIVEAGLPLLHQPEFLIQLAHEIGHYLVQSSYDFQKHEAARRKLQVRPTVAELPELIQTPKINKQLLTQLNPENLVDAAMALDEEFRHIEEKLRETLADAFADIFMVWQLMLNDRQMYLRDFWHKFCACEEGNAQWDKTAPDDELVVHVFWAVIRNVLVVHFARSPHRRMGASDAKSCLKELGAVAADLKARSNSRVADVLVSFCEPTFSGRVPSRVRAALENTLQAAVKTRYGAVVEFFSEHLNRIPSTEQKAEKRSGGLWLCEHSAAQEWMIDATTTLLGKIAPVLGLPEDDHSLEGRFDDLRSSAAVWRTQLAEGKIISSADLDNSTSGRRHSRRVSQLFYAYYANLYGLEGNTPGALIEQGMNWILGRDADFKPLLGEDDSAATARQPGGSNLSPRPGPGHLLFDPHRGLFSFGAEFRGRLFGMRTAFIYSLYDVSERSKMLLIRQD